jgi:hypothetical protein
MLFKSVITSIVVSLLLASAIEGASHKKPKRNSPTVVRDQGSELLALYIDNAVGGISFVMLFIFGGLLLYAIGMILFVFARLLFPN